MIHKVSQFVSRCAVCEVQRKILAVHAQSGPDPECPPSFKKIQTGYSFLAYLPDTDETHNDMNAVQELSSSGSCLKSYIPGTALNCGAKACSIDDPDKFVWLGKVRLEFCVRAGF